MAGLFGPPFGSIAERRTVKKLKSMEELAERQLQLLESINKNLFYLCQVAYAQTAFDPNRKNSA